MPPATLLDWLRARYPTAKTQTLKRMAQADRVTVNGAPARRLSVALAPSDHVEVDERPTPRTAAPARAPNAPQIVYEDADLLVVNKPPGLLTSTVPGERRPTLLAQVRGHVARTDPRARVGLIHRLDRDASGLLVFSKNDAAYRSLKTQLFHHTVERVYAAVVQGVPNPPAGRIESHLVERADGTVHVTHQHGKGEHAVTEYETVESVRKRSLLRVTLRTGRKHQIRVHMASRGTPIVGDRVYGNVDVKGGGEPLMLCAVRLSIDHPRTGERRAFELPVPAHFAVRRRDTSGRDPAKS